MAKKNKQNPPIGKVIGNSTSYGVIGKIGQKLFGKKKGWGDFGGVDTGSRTKRNK